MFEPTDFNFDSVDHLSALLYGGEVTVKKSTQVNKIYQSGPKKGLDYLANVWYNESKIFPRLVEPLKGSELKKEGRYSTDEPTLLKLPKPRKLIDLLLKRSEIEKLLSTYYTGIPKLLTEMDWKDGLVHGQLNQCVARTGRLSASRPNQQNFDPRINQFIVSRF